MNMGVLVAKLTSTRIDHVPLQLPLLVAVITAIFKVRADLVAENLALRHQLSCLHHRNSRPRFRPLDRFLWAALSRFWPRWRELLVIVKPATMVGWHRMGFRLCWRWKSRPRRGGRPKVCVEIRKLIIKMANANIGWGAPRIHGELRKLGIDVAESTVSKYMPKRGTVPGSRQSWRTFLANHKREMLAIDFAVVPTPTFEIIYVFFVLSVDRRKVLHFNVTRHPNAEWTAFQVLEACGFETPGRYLVRDNDRIYGKYFRDSIDGLGLMQVKTVFHCPWQNPFAERWIGSLRRGCLDHVIAISEDQLRRVIRSWISYYHEDRTHLGLGKDTPSCRVIEGPERGKIIALARVGGLHHRYSREASLAA